MYRLSATTSATGSPTKRTSPSASGGRGVSGPLPIAVCHCSLTPAFSSAAVNTNRTPGNASAAEVSIPRIAARGYGLRTKYACSMPGNVTSSTYVPWPVSRRASSTRATRAPTYRAAPAAGCVMTPLPRRRPGAPRRRCPGSRCSDTGCPTALRESPSSVGFGWSRRNAVTDTTNPGVQKPHCRPWQSRNAACTGESSPSGPAMPSTVVTSAPSACTANTRHARTAAPSTNTLHAPHTPCSQPRCVPVR